ncbi:hypothetical protein PoB_003284900 [Plakobranchus ocellatus]|uniref:Uncharacterized protein n=1 Tax=Plakobranchus ocellatus TaxID=259542 RepID=A0AAV4AJC8_9GAST|nr:hypothetical protein PoB_003284900 [Plakobranchus ocellatus]
MKSVVVTAFLLGGALLMSTAAGNYTQSCVDALVSCYLSLSQAYDTPCEFYLKSYDCVTQTGPKCTIDEIDEEVDNIRFWMEDEGVEDCSLPEGR